MRNAAFKVTSIIALALVFSIVFSPFAFLWLIQTGKGEQIKVADSFEEFRLKVIVHE